MQRIDSCAADWRDDGGADRERAADRNADSQRNDDRISRRRDSRDLCASSADRLDRSGTSGLIDVLRRANSNRSDGRCASCLRNVCCAGRRDWRDGDCAIGVPSELCTCSTNRRNDSRARSHELRSNTGPDRRDNSAAGGHELRCQAFSDRGNNGIPERNLRQ